MSLSCPASDGTQFSVGSQVFNIHCATDFYGGDLALVSSSTFEDCLSSCAATSGCVDVAYVGTNCYMKNSLKPSQSNSNVWGAVLATAEAATNNGLSCVDNKSDGTTYTAASGDQFVIACGTDYYGGDLSNLYTDTFEQCLEACDTTQGCIDVAYSSNYCYLKNTLNPGNSNANVWGAQKVQSSSTTATTTSSSSITTATLPATTTTSSSAPTTTSATSSASTTTTSTVPPVPSTTSTTSSVPTTTTYTTTVPTTTTASVPTTLSTSTTAKTTTTSTTTTPAAPNVSKYPGTSCSGLPSSVTSNGKTFNTACGSSFITYGSNLISQTKVADFESCINLCASTTNCGGVTLQNRSNQCYLVVSTTKTTNGAQSDSAALVQ